MGIGLPSCRAETTYGIMRRVTDDQLRVIGELNNKLSVWLRDIANHLVATPPAERFGSDS